MSKGTRIFEPNVSPFTLRCDRPLSVCPECGDLKQAKSDLCRPCHCRKVQRRLRVERWAAGMVAKHLAGEKIWVVSRNGNEEFAHDIMTIIEELR